MLYIEAARLMVCNNIANTLSQCLNMAAQKSRMHVHGGGA